MLLLLEGLRDMILFSTLHCNMGRIGGDCLSTVTKDGRLAKYQVRGLSTIVDCDKSVITLFSLSTVQWNG
jgi:hypothetical protein